MVAGPIVDFLGSAHGDQLLLVLAVPRQTANLFIILPGILCCHQHHSPIPCEGPWQREDLPDVPEEQGFRLSRRLYLLMHLEATRIQDTIAGAALDDRYIAVRVDVYYELSYAPNEPRKNHNKKVTSVVDFSEGEILNGNSNP